MVRSISENSDLEIGGYIYISYIYRYLYIFIYTKSEQFNGAEKTDLPGHFVSAGEMLK